MKRKSAVLIPILSAVLFCMVCSIACATPKHEHNYLQKSDETYHWQQCDEDGCDMPQKNKESHTYGEWKVVTEATEDSAGLKMRNCTGCGYLQLEEIPKEKHVHAYTKQVTEVKYLKSAADCTHKAVYFKSCKCGEPGTDTFEYGEPDGHKPATAVRENEIDATCTTDGSYDEVVKCSVCGVEIGREHKTVNHTGHKYKATWDKNDDKHWHECTVCGDKGSLADHDYSNGDCVCGEKIYIGTPGLTFAPIGETGTYACTGILSAETDLIIPSKYAGKPVTAIAEDAFSHNTKIVSVTIPKSITSIGMKAFSECGKIESITIESGNPNYRVAGNCIIEKDSKTLIAGFKNSVIPDDGSVEIIGDYAFYECYGLDEIVIPSGIVCIDDFAFNSCTDLKSIEFPASVTSIGAKAFGYCSGLTELTLPSTVASIGDNAFERCFEIKRVNCESQACLDKFNSVFFSCGKIGTVYLGDGITNIGENAFVNCSSITNVIVSKNVKSIGEGAFDCPLFKAIYYKGTAQDWESVKNGDGAIPSAAKVYFYSESTPPLNAEGTAYDGNYWRYDIDGKTPIAWKYMSFNVRFMTNYEGSATPTFYTVQAESGDRINAPEGTPARDGHTFTGWYTAKRGGKRVEFPYATTEKIDLYAHWESDRMTPTDNKFDAEFTYFDPTEIFPGYSGTSNGVDCIVTDGEYGDTRGAWTDTYAATLSKPAGKNHYVSSLYRKGLTITYEIYAAEDCTATLYASLACFYLVQSATFAPTGEHAYKFTVNDEEVNYAPIDVNTRFSEYSFGTINLKAGKNVIKLITDNSTISFGGTTAATAPDVDYIKLDTKTALTWSPVYDNLYKLD